MLERATAGRGIYREVTMTIQTDGEREFIQLMQSFAHSIATAGKDHEIVRAAAKWERLLTFHLAVTAPPEPIAVIRLAA